MNPRRVLIAATLCLPLASWAQHPTAIPLTSEPHHHLVLHNDLVNVYTVQVGPQDSVLLHRHDFDAIGIMLGDAEITVRTPGKPDSHQKVAGGQLRLQPAGYVHSTTIEGNTVYRNVTVELLSPQLERRNICASVIPAQPLNCPSELPDRAGVWEQPQFETNQTKINLTRLKQQQSVSLNASAQSRLIVALDDGVFVTAGNGPPKALRRGDALWLDNSGSGYLLNNMGSKEIRMVTFVFTNDKSAK